MPIEYEFLADNNGITFEEFLEKHNLTVVVKERPKSWGKGLLRYYASFKELIEVKEDIFLSTISGNGDTPDIALEDLMLRLTGKLLVRNAYGNREEFYAPNEWRKS